LFVIPVGPLSVEVKVSELERRVDALSKALHLILFEEAVTLPRKEMDELKERLSAYVHGKKTEFVPLDVLLGNAQGNTAQKGRK